MRFIKVRELRLCYRPRLLNRILIWLFLLCFAYSCQASEEKEPPHIGNFALPISQEPGPLVSFGQNILAKNETQLFLLADDFVGVQKHFIDAIPGVLYGLTDDLSIFVNAPIAVNYQTSPNHSAGWEDAFVQLEYVFYEASTSLFLDQATVVSNITFPTGSIQKNPATGVGSPSFFIGATYSHTYVDWFVFASPGVVLTTAKNGTKFGNTYLYQAGFGRNIANIDGWLLAWMIEGDGNYTQKNRVRGSIDPNSGGNIIYVTPSLWASTKQFIFQFGVGFPVTQHSFGNQTSNTYTLIGNVGWSIY